MRIQINGKAYDFGSIKLTPAGAPRRRPMSATVTMKLENPEESQRSLREFTEKVWETSRKLCSDCRQPILEGEKLAGLESGSCTVGVHAECADFAVATRGATRSAEPEERWLYLVGRKT